MPYDGLFTAAICRELQQTIAGARIDKIFQPAPDTLLLHLRQPGETYKLVLSANAQNPRVHLTTEKPDNPIHAPTFCMLLRKYLDPGRIVTVEQAGLDRILRLLIDAFDEDGQPVRRLLIAELTGRNSNILLVDKQSGRIIDALKRAPAHVNTYRTILPGETYIPPPAAGKVDPRRLSLAELTRQIDVKVQSQSQPLQALLTEQFDGVGPFAARELGLQVETGPKIDGHKAHAVAEALYEMSRLIETGQFTPTLKVDEAGVPIDFWLFRPRQWEFATCRELPSVNDAADTFFTARVRRQKVSERRNLLRRGVNTVRKRLERKASALRKDLEQASKAEQYRIWGELLTASMHLVGRGDSATVPDYYDGGKLVTIPLDPTIGPAANAQKYFRRYTKAKRARTVVQRQLDATLDDIAWLEQTSVHIDIASTEEQLDEIGRELTQAGMLPRNVQKAWQQPQRQFRRPKVKNKGAAASRPLEALIGEGVRVLIGTNSRQNERISLRIAKPDDIWLHAKDIAGAHVLLPRAGDKHLEPDARLIAEAAALAAYFSKARHSSNVPVDWTLAKHVRKPRGARPGMVIYDNHKTVYVTPDEQKVLKQVAAARR